MKTRVLSGVRTSGELHIGNYLGALRKWVRDQNERDCFFFVADLHGLTEVEKGHNPTEYAQNRLRTAAGYIASGIDPNLATLFLQSAVPQHTELLWLISTVARKGELERMTQWKDKGGTNQAGAASALFIYPVLMASDILLYDANEVPVGDDQRQHVEITRDWAERFNNYFGTTFVVPEAVVPPEAARIMDLQFPESKMSKSAEGAGTLLFDDSPDVLRAKVRRAVTDSGSSIRHGREKPGITNLLHIYAALSDRSIEAIEKEFVGKSYGEFKDSLADLVVSVLEPIGERMRDLLNDRGELSRLLAIGSERASEVAERTCLRAREALGVGAL